MTQNYTDGGVIYLNGRPCRVKIGKPDPALIRQVIREIIESQQRKGMVAALADRR